MNKTISNTAQLEERIEGSIDKDAMALTQVSDTAGGLAFKDMGQVMEFSKLMAVSKQAVPKHLRGQPGACMAVSLQAMNWRMDPFAVANKSYSVNDRIVYEAQLIQAVIEQRAPIKGRIKGSYTGEGGDRQCVLRVMSAEDGEEIEYTSPKIKDITVKNSPLWKSDPDQQLWYYSARAMCRRHFPDVLLGVYEKEEIENAPGMKNVTPGDTGFAKMANAARGPEPEPAQEPENERQAPVEEIEDAEIVPDEDQPNFDPEIVEAGAEAFRDDFGRADCPHRDDAEKAAAWLAGWDAAAEEDQ